MRSLILALGAVLFTASAASAEETLLLREPDVSANHVVFAYAGDLWIAPRDGGDARRLTSFPGVEAYPKFSPDGSLVAFTGEYDGNVDVYLVPTAGGEPVRLTWHPGYDVTRGWTPDGKCVVFASGRDNPRITASRFWTVSVDGGPPEAMPMPRAWRGQVAPDGKRVAYEMVQPWENEFRNYRGGQNRPIWVLDLADYALTELPWEGSHDTDPVWAGGTVCFLSDRDYAVNVYAWDAASKSVRQLTHFRDFDVKNLETDGATLIFECGGRLYLQDPAGGEAKPLSFTARGDFPWARPHWEDAASMMRNGRVSPGGKRAVFEARGEIFTVPAEKGDVRNLSGNAAAADRAPAWSPDGASIAWFSDASGEYRLMIADQFGENRREIAIPHPTFFYDPQWSPDSKWIAFTDADRVLWTVEVATGKVREVDGEGYAHPVRTIYPEWSPDSKWIAYVKRLDNEFNAVQVYSMETGERHPVTDGLSDCRAPAWDKGGKYLYFLSSTDYGLNVGWLDMSNYERPITSSVYMAVLSSEEPSPLAPESDDEAVTEDAPKEEKPAAKHGRAAKEEESEEETKPAPVRIDFDGLGRRVVALDVPPAEYLALTAGAEGTLFIAEAAEPNADDEDNEVGVIVNRYSLEDREATDFLEDVSSFSVSADGKHVLYGMGGMWGIVDADGSPAPGDGKLNTADVRLKVDPPAEWLQIFREAWRYQRDYFYVRNVHGLDLKDVYDRYEPLVEQVRHRSDLTYLLDVLGGETSVGHSFVAEGDVPDIDHVPVGLLGADLIPDRGWFRIARIFDGEEWNPDLAAPLSAPGLNVKEGDYLVAVNGVELTADMNPYSLFDRTAGKQTVLTINARPGVDGTREVTVVPVGNDTGLRTIAWVEGNRRRVDELSGGKLAYVWLPDTGFGGYTNFNRYYFAQKEKQGAIVDERYNHGGSAADYIVDILARPLLGYFSNPIGDRTPFTCPGAGIWGPKVMVVNEMAGSGGDLLPYMFKARQVGPVVGKRTWGGLVGIWDVPELIDGGYITAPRGGFFNTAGQWDVENKGIAPDIEVEMTPAEVIAGRDPQLEKAVEVALEMLRKNPVVLKPQPPDPVRVKRPE